MNHTVRCCGTGSPMGQQWAQIRVTGGTIGTTPVQQQIYPGANDGLHRWMGSVAVDKLGDMALGYSAANSTTNPDIRYAGRLAGDPAGTLPLTETTMLPGVTRGTQLGNCGGSTCIRWGDYSAMVLDPNGCDFWFTTEYYATTGMNWQTRIGSFRLNPNCAAGGGGGTTSQTITFDALVGQDVRRRRLHGQRDGVVRPARVVLRDRQLHGLGQRRPPHGRRLVHDHGLAGG